VELWTPSGKQGFRADLQADLQLRAFVM